MSRYECSTVGAVNGDEHLPTGDGDVVGCGADTRSCSHSTRSEVNAQEQPAAVVAHPQRACTGGEVVRFLPDTYARSHPPRRGVDDREAARVPVAEPDAAVTGGETDVVRRGAEHRPIERTTRRGRAHLDGARPVNRDPEPTSARIDCQVVRRPARSHRADDTAGRDRDEDEPTGVFGRNPEQAPVAAEIDVMRAAGNAHSGANARRARRASMIVTASAGGLETATKRPSALAATLWGPAGTRSRETTRHGRPRSTATSPARSSATYATASGAAGRACGTREAARSTLALAPRAAARMKREARARLLSPVVAVCGLHPCFASRPVWWLRSAPDSLPSRAEGPPVGDPSGCLVTFNRRET
jgi:hypothetical protein